MKYSRGLGMSERERSFFWKGLILGLFGGIIGNLFVAYLMKVFDYLNYSLWTWVLSAIMSFLVVMLLAWVMWKQIVKDS
jgi:fructose-specific phosphotransferase system IIC component